MTVSRARDGFVLLFERVQKARKLRRNFVGQIIPIGPFQSRRH